jgi:23S rRNA pseudouridine2605 synthase
VRQGDNPWYEVVLIEGRNRELRKMFEEIGHFVEKIRRVGYGPLVLDQEPGNLRELEPEELDALRKTADGKAKTPKAKDIRRRNTLDKLLPTLPPKPSRHRPPAAAFDRKESERPRDLRAGTRVPGEFRPKPRFGAERPARPVGEGSRPTGGRADSGTRKFVAARFEGKRPGPAKFGPAKGPARPVSGRPGPTMPGTGKPAWKKDDRPSGRFSAGPGRENRAGGDRGKPGFAGREPSGVKGAFGTRPPAPNRSGGHERGAHKRPTPQRREAPAAEDFAAPKPSQLRIDPIEAEQPRAERPSSGRPPYRPAGTRRPSNAGAGSGRTSGGRPTPHQTQFERPQFNRPKFDRGSADRPSFDRASGNRPSGGPGRSSAGGYGHGRPARAEGGLARPFTSSTGKPRAGGPRPSSKRSGPGDRPYRTDGAGTRSGSRSPGKAAWKPRPDAVGTGKPTSGGRSKPTFGSKSGDFSKSGYKGKSGSGGGRPSGSRPSGPRPGGKSGGGPSRGKKRG